MQIKYQNNLNITKQPQHYPTTHQLFGFNLIGSLDNEGLNETHKGRDVARAFPQDRGQEVGKQCHVGVWNPRAVHLHQQGQDLEHVWYKLCNKRKGSSGQCSLWICNSKHHYDPLSKLFWSKLVIFEGHKKTFGSSLKHVTIAGLQFSFHALRLLCHSLSGGLGVIKVSIKAKRQPMLITRLITVCTEVFQQ